MAATAVPTVAGVAVETIPFARQGNGGGVSLRKALFICHNFPPAGGSGVQRNLKFVRYARDFGYEPEVVTVTTDHLDETADASMADEVAGVPIHRVPLGRHWTDAIQDTRSGRVFRKLLLAPDDRILWKAEVIRHVRHRFKPGQFDVVFIGCPPSSCSFLTRGVGEHLRRPVVLDFRDPASQARRIYPYPTLLHELYIDRAIRDAVDTAAAVVVVTPGSKRLFGTWNPKCADKVAVIYNGYDPEDFEGLATLPAVLPGGSNAGILNLGYAGVMHSPWRKPQRTGRSILDVLRGQVNKPGMDGSTYSLKHLLEAMELLFRSRPDCRGRIRIHLCGDIAPENFELAAGKGLGDAVVNHGYLPHKQALRMLMDVDVLYTPMVSGFGPCWNHTIPGKIFEYFHFNKPIFAITPSGDLMELLRAAGVQTVAEMGDADRAAAILASLFDDHGAGRPTAGVAPLWARQFERRQSARLLADIFDRVVH